MKEQFSRFLDGLHICNVIGLVSLWMFGLVGFSVWLIGLMIDKHIKK